MKILDLGCGKRKQKGAVGIDISKDTDADVIHDLNVFPYPFADNEFDYIYADNIIEHLDIIPFFRSHYAFIDPTHKHFFTVRSFDYFDPEKEFNHLYKYSQCCFKIKKVLFDENMRHGLFGKMITYFANKKPIFYETRISIIFPLNTLTYYLEVLKK